MNLSMKNIDKKVSKVSNIFAKSIIRLSDDHTDSSHIVASKKSNFSTILQRFLTIFRRFSTILRRFSTILRWFPTIFWRFFRVLKQFSMILRRFSTILLRFPKIFRWFSTDLQQFLKVSRRFSTNLQRFFYNFPTIFDDFGAIFNVFMADSAYKTIIQLLYKANTMILLWF